MMLLLKSVKAASQKYQYSSSLNIDMALQWIREHFGNYYESSCSRKPEEN